MIWFVKNIWKLSVLVAKQLQVGHLLLTVFVALSLSYSSWFCENLNNLKNLSNEFAVLNNEWK